MAKINSVVLSPNYNAVKIDINNPQVKVPEAPQPKENCCTKPIYDYPKTSIYEKPAEDKKAPETVKPEAPKPVEEKPVETPKAAEEVKPEVPAEGPKADVKVSTDTTTAPKADETQK